MLLVPVLERSLEACETRLAEVGEAIGIAREAEAVFDYLKQLVDELNIPTTLESFGYSDDDLEDLVTAAGKVTRLLDNNPKAFTAEDIRQVFLAVSRPK